MARTLLATARPLVPARLSKKALEEAAADCRACPLWKRGTQTVFGRGPKGAALLFVGEQPGNDEDLAGKPFVGPAGKLFDWALGEAGIAREEAYVTNVVKHFKWVPKGRLRIHQKPNAREIGACVPWLEAEIALIRPKILVALGATAASALLGPAYRVTRDRGTFVTSRFGPQGTGTVHPSSILRSPTEEERRVAKAKFVDDLKVLAAAIHGRA
jgi:uracil-DNA glycosylase family protein